MPNTCFVGILLSVAGILLSGAITAVQAQINIMSPARGAVIAEDTLAIRVSPADAAQLQRLEAEVAGRVQPFVLEGFELWARIPLAGLEKKSHHAVVTAEYLDRSILKDTIPFFNASGITLNIGAPKDYAVAARSAVHVKVSAIGMPDTSLQIKVYSGSLTGGGRDLLVSKYGPIDTVLSLTCHEGDWCGVEYRCFYKDVRVASAQTSIIRESSNALVPVDSVDGLLVDYDGRNFIYVDSSWNYAVKSRSGGSPVALPRPAGLAIDSPAASAYFLMAFARTTKAGIVTKYRKPHGGSNYLFLWNGEENRPIGNGGYYRPTLAFSSNRQWVAWHDVDTASIILAGEGGIEDTLRVSPDSLLPGSLSIADDGTVAFVGSANGEKNIFLHKADSTWKLTNGGVNGNPETNGKMTLFTRMDSSGYSLLLHDGSRDTVLTKVPERHGYLDIHPFAGDWGAYHSLSQFGAFQSTLIRRRESGSLETKVIGGPQISSVSAHGQMVIHSGFGPNSRKYSAYDENTLHDAGSRVGNEVFVEDTLFVLLGNTLFRFDKSRPNAMHRVGFPTGANRVYLRILGSSAAPWLELPLEEVAGGQVSVSVFDLQGKRIARGRLNPTSANGGVARISLSPIEPGAYLVSIQSATRRYHRKVVFSP